MATPSDSAAQRHPLVGYFASPTQTQPEHDADAPCPLCTHPVTPDDVRTISLMPEGAAVSVFFRVHRTCAEADPGAVLEVEHRIIEETF